VKQYYVYIMANRSGTLYAGVTSDLERRVFEHKNKTIPGFTSRYKVNMLVYFEETNDVRAALAREKQIKGWRKARKIALVQAVYPTFSDLSAEWFD
jgi:putative endonuclease